MTFVLAMVLNPGIQKRAQEELDSALSASGASFPSFELRNQLPYLEAVVKETLRWHPVFPFGESWFLGNYSGVFLTDVSYRDSAENGWR